MRKLRIPVILVGISLITATMTFAQEKLSLTLEDSIRLALSQNPFHLATEERIDAARSQMREAAAAFFPSLNASGLHTLDEKVMELEFPSFIPGQPPQKVRIDFTRDYQFSLSLSLPLFTGGRLISGFKQAGYNLRSTEETVRQSRHMTVYNTKQAFYGYLLAKEFVKVAEEAVGVAQGHLDNVNKLYEVGMASKFDLLRSEVQVANLQPQLIKARNSLKIAELGLKNLLGIDLATPIEVMGELRYEPYQADTEAIIIQALQNRPEIKQLGYQKQMAGELLKINRAASLPTVALSGTYNFWADALNFRQNTWQNYYSVNLVVSIPIFNGFSTAARVAQSKAMIRELELSHKGLIEAVEFEVRQAVLKIQEAKESLLSQGKNVEQAQESLRIAELNYSEGMATTLDVSSTQAALTQAKTNYSQALFDFAVARAELEKAVGQGWDENR